MTKNVKQYQNTLNLIKDFMPQAKLDNYRGHHLHIRATNVTDDQYNAFKENQNYVIENTCQDTRYSTSYNTIFIKHNNDSVPCVLSYGELKKNKKDSLVQKQLTPNKLGISGEYTELKLLLYNVKESLKPRLNKELTNLLVKLCDQIIDPTQSFTTREQELLIAHNSSLGKDFGEILAAIDCLNTFGNVTIALSESSANFDFSYLDEYGVIHKYNTKSGNGSGQSFKSIKNEFLSLSDDFKKETSAHICVEMINSLCNNNNIKGRDRIFNMAKEAQKLKNIDHSDPLGKILDKISKAFFNEQDIDKKNYVPPETFAEYSEKIKTIWNDLSLRKIGLPTGSNADKPDVFYSTNKNGKENAILFTLATLIAYYFNNKVITIVMQKLLKTKIYIMHVSFNNNGVYFTTPTEVTYKFHYWGNFKNPTNNLPGFKAIYEK